MASNIKEKNLIYSFEEYASMPYSSVKHIDYSNDNGYLNSTSLNNTYQQLLDNDKYIAQQLMAKKDYQVGPDILSKTSPEQQIRGMANGEKFFQSNDAGTIFKKVEKAIQDSIVKAADGRGIKFSDGIDNLFIAGQDMLLICFKDKTYSISISQFEAQNEDVDIVSLASKVVDENGNDIVVYRQAIGQTRSLLLACHTAIAHGIYKIDQYENACHLVYELSKDVSVKSMAYRDSDGTLAFVEDIGSASRLYVCKVSPDGTIDTSTMSSIMYVDKSIDGCQISHAMFADTLKQKYPEDNCILVFMDNGTVKSSKIGNRLDISDQKDFGPNNAVHGSLWADGQEWYATSNGLFKAKPCEQPTPAIDDQPVDAATKSIAYDGSSIWTGYDDGTISSYSIDHQKYSYGAQLPNSPAVQSLQFANGILVAATDNGLFVEQSAQFLEISSNGLQQNGLKLSCSALATSVNDDSSCNVYAIGKCQGHSGFLAIANIGVPEDVETDIFSSKLSSLQLDADKIQLYAHKVDTEDGQSMHCFALVEDGSTIYLKNITVGEEILSMPLSDYHGMIWTDNQIAVVKLSTLLVYQDISPGTSQYTNAYAIDKCLLSSATIDGNTVSCLSGMLVGGAFDGDSHILMLVQSNVDASSTKKLVYVCRDGSGYNYSIPDIYVNDIQTDISILGDSFITDVIVSASSYYALSSNQTMAFNAIPRLDGITISGNIGNSDVQASSIDLSTSNFVPGFDLFLSSTKELSVKVYEDGDDGSQVYSIDVLTSNAYKFNRLDYCLSKSSVSAISSIGYATDDGLEIYRTRITSYQQNLSKIQFAPYWSPWRNCALLISHDVEETNYSHMVSVVMAKSMSNDMTLQQQLSSDPSSLWKISSNKFMASIWNVGPGSYDSTIFDIVSSENGTTSLISVYIAYAGTMSPTDENPSHDYVNIAVVSLSAKNTDTNFNCWTYNDDIDILTSNANSIHSIIECNQSAFIAAKDILYAYHRELEFVENIAKPILTCDEDIVDVFVDYNDKSYSQGLPYPDIDLSSIYLREVDGQIVDNPDLNMPQLAELYDGTVDQLIEENGTFVGHDIHTRNLKPKIKVVTATSLYVVDPDDMANPVVYNNILANGRNLEKAVPMDVSPWSNYNDVFQHQTTNQQNSIYVDSHNGLYEYFGKKRLALGKHQNQYFGIDSTEELRSLAVDSNGAVWMQGTTGSISAFAKDSLVEVYSNVDSDQMPAFVPNTSLPIDNSISAFIYMPDFQLSNTVAQYSGNSWQTSKLLSTDVAACVKSMSPRVDGTEYDARHPYIVVKDFNAGIESICTFDYVQYLTADIEMSRFATTDQYSFGKSLVLAEGISNAIVIDNAGRLVSYDYASNSFSLLPTSIGQICFPNNVHGTALIAITSNSQGVSCMSNAFDYSTYIPLDIHSKLVEMARGEGLQLCSLSYYNNEYHLFARAMAATDSSQPSMLEFTWPYVQKDSLLMRSTKVEQSLDLGSVDSTAYLGNSNYLLASSTGIFKYQFALDKNDQPADICYKVYDGMFCNAMQKFYIDGLPAYSVAVGSKVLSSSLGYLWNEMLDVGEDSSPLSSYVQYNYRCMFAGKHSEAIEDNGLYCIAYTYSIEDDTQHFTSESAVALYDSCEDRINAAVYSAIDKHIEEMHGSGSTASLLNAYMPIDFSIPNTFLSIDGDISHVQNDYIERILTGDYSTGEVTAKATNTLRVGSRWLDIKLNYIAKQWASGIVELYIYLPTTGTYYIPHVDGASYCADSTDEIEVVGVPIVPSIAQNATHIKLSILSSYFFFDSIYENTIKGNSLPLKIKKDTTYAEQEGVDAMMYHSFVEPSIASDIDVQSTSFDYYLTDYYCFGSDAQAIKIVAYDPQKNFLKKHKTVIYNGQGGTTTSQQQVVQQRLLDGGSQKQMYWDIFQQDNAIFLGWSTSKSAVEPDYINYPEGKMFDYSTLETNTVNLYAVWSTYVFSENDTSLTFAKNDGLQYNVAQVKIDPDAVLGNNPKLDNRLIVKRS